MTPQERTALEMVYHSLHTTLILLDTYPKERAVELIRMNMDTLAEGLNRASWEDMQDNLIAKAARELDKVFDVPDPDPSLRTPPRGKLRVVSDE